MNTALEVINDIEYTEPNSGRIIFVFVLNQFHHFFESSLSTLDRCVYTHNCVFNILTSSCYFNSRLLENNLLINIL